MNIITVEGKLFEILGKGFCSLVVDATFDTYDWASSQFKSIDLDEE